MDLAGGFKTVVSCSVVGVLETSVALTPDGTIPPDPLVFVGEYILVALGSFGLDWDERRYMLNMRFIGRTDGFVGSRSIR